jgi:hypothetical protein
MKKTIALILITVAVLFGATTGNIQWSQLASASRHGTGSKGQASDGTGASGNLASFNANGSLTDSTVSASGIGLVPTGSGTSGTFSGNSKLFVCTAACSLTVPVPAAGVTYCARDAPGVTGAITLSAIGSSAHYEATDHSAYGTAGTGTMTSTTAAGNQICIFGLDSTHYLTISSNGTFTTT